MWTSREISRCRESQTNQRQAGFFHRSAAGYLQEVLDVRAQFADGFQRSELPGCGGLIGLLVTFFDNAVVWLLVNFLARTLKFTAELTTNLRATEAE